MAENSDPLHVMNLWRTEGNEYSNNFLESLMPTSLMPTFPRNIRNSCPHLNALYLENGQIFLTLLDKTHCFYLWNFVFLSAQIYNACSSFGSATVPYTTSPTIHGSSAQRREAALRLKSQSSRLVSKRRLGPGARVAVRAFYSCSTVILVTLEMFSEHAAQVSVLGYYFINKCSKRIKYTHAENCTRKHISCVTKKSENGS